VLDQRDDYLGDHTVADAILDRPVYNALKGDSIPKRQAPNREDR